MRYLSIFTLLVSAASLASANTISIGCSTNIYNGQNGSGQSSVCAGFSVPGGFNLTGVTYDYAIDFQFNLLQPGTRSILADLNGPGGADAMGILVNTANRPLVGTVVVAPADWAAFLAGASIGTSYVGASTSVTGATFDTQVNFTYETQSGVPEPSTLALVGGVLVLAGIRKFRS